MSDGGSLAAAEEKSWHQLIDRLKEAGVITQEDCEAEYGSDDTAGQRLLKLIVEWGHALADFRIQSDYEEEFDPDDLDDLDDDLDEEGERDG